MLRRKHSAVVMALAAVAAAAGDDARATGVSRHREASESPAGRIAYSVSRSDPADPAFSRSDIYTSTPTGGDTRRLIRGASDPVWAPRGRWIAYEHHGQIWRIRADGSRKRRVTRLKHSASEPTWSPDGKRLAYARSWVETILEEPSDRSAIYVVRRDGTGTRELDPAFTIRAARDPEWSPDGRMIAFSYNGRLGAHKRNGEVLDDLAGGRQVAEICFSPSGRALFFVGGLGTPDLAGYILDLRTRALTTIPLAVFGGLPASVTWTPDGRFLAFLLRTDPVELHIVRPNGTDERQLASLPPGVEAEAGFSWTGFG